MEDEMQFAGVFVRKNGKILLVQEGHREAYGLWSLPGGHVEQSESERGAAVREAREETGYIVKLNGRHKVLRMPGVELKSLRQYNDKRIKLTIFEAETVGGVMNQGSGILDVRWVSEHDLATTPLRGEWIRKVAEEFRE